MVEVCERRPTGAKSLPNVVRVIDRERLAWMKRGNGRKTALVGIGGRNPTTTDTRGPRGVEKADSVQGSSQAMQEPWKVELISVRPGAGNWIEVRAPWDLHEGARTLVGTRLIYEARERRVQGYHEDELEPISKGDLVTINLELIP